MLYIFLSHYVWEKKTNIYYVPAKYLWKLWMISFNLHHLPGRNTLFSRDFKWRTSNLKIMVLCYLSMCLKRLMQEQKSSHSIQLSSLCKKNAWTKWLIWMLGVIWLADKTLPSHGCVLRAHTGTVWELRLKGAVFLPLRAYNLRHIERVSTQGVSIYLDFHKHLVPHMFSFLPSAF